MLTNADIFAALLEEDFPEGAVSVEGNHHASISQTNLPGPSKDSGHDCVEQDKTLKNNTVHKPSPGLSYDVDIFNCTSQENISIGSASNQTDKSVVHTYLTDSSDDEENKYFEESKYNSFGKDIKKQLKDEQLNRIDRINALLRENSTKKNSTSSDSFQIRSRNPNQICLPEKREIKTDVYADPVFGIRLLNPLISSRGLSLKMEGKAAVTLSKLKIYIDKELSEAGDFVVAGVIVRSVTKQSQTGNQYMIWEISDLKDELLTVSIFLFGCAYKALWKTSVGTVIGILNPSSNKKDNGVFSLSVNNHDQVMIWGTSKDYGICKAVKKNGDKCSSFINKSVCEYCVYHLKKEYKKFSGNRSELQSPMGGRMANAKLINKVLGKNEVFYGGRSFTALKPGAPVKKVSVEDQKRLTNLGITVLEKPTAGVSTPIGSMCTRGAKMMKKLGHSTSTSYETGMSVGKTQSAKDSSRLMSLFSDTENKIKSSVPIAARNNSKEIDEPKKMFNKKLPSNKSQPLLQKLKQDTSSPQLPALKPLEGLKNKSSIVATVEKTVKRPALSDPCSNKVVPRLTNFSTGDSDEFNNIRSDGIREAGGKKSKVSIKSPSELKKRFNSLISLDIPKRNHIKKSIPLSNSKENENNLPTQSEIGVKDVKKCNLPTLTETVQISSQNKSVVQKRFFDDTPRPVQRKMSRAKMKAIQIIQKQGVVFKPETPRSKLLKEHLDKKRKRNEEDEIVNAVKSKFSKEFLRLMNEGPKCPELVEMEQLRQEEEYFNKMGVKEAIEEKMLNTYKVDCKAVRCLKCKYTWFSSSETCKAERHPIKVVDAVKRFFRCGDCSNRTVALTVVPLINCNQCEGSNWIRAAMIREKVVKLNDNLSIRGDEQKNFNSSVNNANINLLVSEESTVM